jgi:uncharacterized protein YlzI (FlbEa/FlbD family)
MQSTAVQEANRQLAQQLIDDAQRNPQSPYAGKCVGLANGKIVVVAEDWDEVGKRLHEVEPNTSRTMCVDVGRDYSKIHEIWELR